MKWSPTCWRSRELARRLFIRDLSAQYRNSVLGYVWVFVPPLMASLPFVYLNSAGVMRMGDTPIPYAAYAIGRHDHLADVRRRAQQPAQDGQRGAFHPHPHQFPARGDPAFRADAGGVQLSRASGAAGRRYLSHSVWRRRATAPLFFVGMLSVALTGFMIGLLLTPIGLLYGDVQHSLPIASTFLMLLTPVLYPVPASGLAAIVAALNPLTPLVTTTRDWLTTGSAAHLGGFVVVSVRDRHIPAARLGRLSRWRCRISSHGLATE